MRRNIDPFSEHSDLELWRVLEQVLSSEATLRGEQELYDWIHVFLSELEFETNGDRTAVLKLFLLLYCKSAGNCNTLCYTFIYETSLHEALC